MARQAPQVLTLFGDPDGADSVVSDLIQSRRPVLLVICSDGGCLDSGLAIANLILARKQPVTGVAFGKCSSAAFVIWAACHERRVARPCLFELHPTAISGSDYDPEDAKRFAYLTSKADGLYFDIVEKQLGKKAAALCREKRKQWLTHTDVVRRKWATFYPGD